MLVTRVRLPACAFVLSCGPQQKAPAKGTGKGTGKGPGKGPGTGPGKGPGKADAKPKPSEAKPTPNQN